MKSFALCRALASALCALAPSLQAQDPDASALCMSLNGRVPTPRTTTYSFDLDHDGTSDTIQFPKVGGGIFAIDVNENGVIDDGSELPGPMGGDALGDLLSFDSNSDGWLTSLDQAWTSTYIWTKTSAGGNALLSMSSVGITSIWLVSGTSPSDNDLIGFYRLDGNIGFLAPVDLLEFLPVDALAACDDGDPKGNCAVTQNPAMVLCVDPGGTCTNNQGEAGVCQDTQVDQGKWYCVCSGSDTSPVLNEHWLVAIGGMLTLVSMCFTARAKVVA